MISYGKQTIDQSDIDAVIEVLNSDWLTQGPAVEKFEGGLKEYFGADFACAVTNGTAALHLASMALEWKENDIILTSPLTFVATSNCIVYSNASPDFVDIDKDSYTIDPNKVEDKVKYYRSKGKAIKAIIGIDFAGHPCDWKSLREIANRHELQLINDNCHGMGSSYENNKKYALEYADIITQSYHPVKHITTGEGGAILTNNSDFDQKIKLLRTHGITKDDSLMSRKDGPWYYEMVKLGYNYRITDFQCALGFSQLKKLDNFINKRQLIASIYNEYFSHIDNIITPKVGSKYGHSYHLYPLQINFKSFKVDKSDFFNFMKKNGVSLQVHYIPVHLQKYYMENYGFKRGDFPLTEKFYENEISLPVYPELTKVELEKVIKNFDEFFKSCD